LNRLWRFVKICEQHEKRDWQGRPGSAAASGRGSLK
jgi:hypothetical protein